MAFYRTCPDCGANLDPGEHCDCRAGDEKERLSSGRNAEQSKAAA